MAAAELERVVDLLRSERMDEQFRLLGAGTLLAELRSAVSAVYSNGTVSRGANMRLMFCIQSLAAPTHELLDAVLHAKVVRSSGGWRQVVPAFLLSRAGNGFSRSTTLRDLRQLSHKFRALASYVKQVHNDFSSTRITDSNRGASSSSYSSIGAVDALRARMIGRSELLEEMVGMVLSDGTGVGGGLLVMPIVGGPGIGKTRLAMALLSDGRVRRRFPVRLAVPVMRHRYYSLERVLLRMTAHIGATTSHDIAAAEASRSVIGHRLRIGGNYLILLDDVWSDGEGSCPEIGALVKALPSNGTLIITTRIPGVVSYLATVAEAATINKAFSLQPLGLEFTSSLAAEWMATYRGDWPAELARAAAAAIADKCGGVPILLDHARERFCEPQGPAFWQGFLHHQQADTTWTTYLWRWRELLARIDGLPHDEFWRRFLRHSGELPDGNAVLESAAISYQHLASDMQSCLLYCSMFPLGHDFDVEELTDLMASEGYIPPVVTKAQRRGFLQQLLDECFYPLQEHQYGDKCAYRMDKVMHIFVQYMNRETSLVIRSVLDQQQAGASIASTTKAITGGGANNNKSSLVSLRRASLILSPSATSFPTSLLQCKDLGALILLQDGDQQHRCEITGIPQEFFQWRIQAMSFRATKVRVLRMPNKFLKPYHVRYLNLSQTDIESIPSSISRLMFLQTLILSHCDKLQKLHPNTTKLALLQKMDLQGCLNLVQLPRDLIKMTRLEHLNVIGCSSLTHLPRGIRQLTNLQMLLGYIVSYDYPDGSSMSELQPLINLHRLSLQNLEKASDPLDARFANLNNKTNLESLSLRWRMDDHSSDTVPAYAGLESLQPQRRLKALEIVGYGGESLPSWMTSTDPYLISLVEIKLINLRSCERVLPPLGLLPCLKIAEISGAETVCSVSGSPYGHRGAFRSLEKLTFSYMHNLEVWEEAQWSGMFPRLAELVIIQCPKLRALHMELPSLKKLILWMSSMALYSLKGALRGVAQTLKQVSISFGEELSASSGFEGLHDLGKLTNLEICGCDELRCLPQGLQQLSSVRSLTIDSCSKLETLPDWLENLPSLQIMRLSGCPLLHSVPGGLQQRPGVIVHVEDCPSLVEDRVPKNFSAQSSGASVSLIFIAVSVLGHPI